MVASVHFNSEVRLDNGLVELQFGHAHGHSVVVVDRATAARLINQLRRTLDQDYNDLINQRP